LLKEIGAAELQGGITTNAATKPSLHQSLWQRSIELKALCSQKAADGGELGQGENL
jgi:hypothetical protein